jgi:hypothetical protein
MSDSPRQLPPKKDVALALLEGPSVLVHLDPRREGVVVPKWFTGQPQLILQVGLNLPVPIPDLAVDDSGISCTLSFSRSPFWCSIPWSAVYALVGDDGRGMVWPNDVPPEVAAQMQKSAPAKGAGAKRPRAKLAAVESREPREAGESEPGRAGARSRPQREARPAEQVAEPGAPDGAEERRQAPGAGAAAGRRNERGPRAPTPLSAAPQPPAQAGSAEEKPDADKVQRPRPVSPGDPKKPKRELPPYLRVIK